MVDGVKQHIIRAPQLHHNYVDVVSPAQTVTEPHNRITYRLMLLGRAAPVVNARLPLTESNVVSEDCGRGRGPS